MKKYLSLAVTIFCIMTTSIAVFASYWKSTESGGTWERGRNDSNKIAYSYYYHSGRTHGATSVTDLRPGTRSRVCCGPNCRAESRSYFSDGNSWHPYWHFCKDTHNGSI